MFRIKFVLGAYLEVGAPYRVLPTPCSILPQFESFQAQHWLWVADSRTALGPNDTSPTDSAL